jgi:hypothetical protein
MSDEPIIVELDDPTEWNVVLVGGNDAIFQLLRSKLANVNITIGAHWVDSKQVQTRVPDRCNGLLILKDFTSHTLADKAKECAEMSGTRWAYITRKWAQTSVALAATGFISPAMGLGPAAHKSGRVSKAGTKVLRTIVAHATGRRVTVEQSKKLFAAVSAAPKILTPPQMDQPLSEYVDHVLAQPTPQVTLQDPEPEAMAKPALTVNVQTIPQPASKPTRDELIELLKMTAVELLTDHHVVEIRITEADGIQLKVMEQLTVKL